MASGQGVLPDIESPVIFAHEDVGVKRSHNCLAKSPARNTGYPRFFEAPFLEADRDAIIVTEKLLERWMS